MAMLSIAALNDDTSKKDSISTTRSISAVTRRAEKIKKEIEELKMLIMPRKQSAKLGTISARIYRSGAVFPQSSHIANLPAEIMRMVVGRLNVPEQVCLALSCKAMAATIESFKDAAGTYHARKKPTTKAHRLQVLAAVHDWMPDKYILCCICGVYKARGETGWKGNTQLDWKTVTARVMEIEGSRCPTCAKRIELDTMKHKREWKQMQRSLKDICK